MFVFCLVNAPKYKDIKVERMQDKDKQQILTFKKQEPTHICYDCSKNDLNNDRTILSMHSNPHMINSATTQPSPVPP